MRRDRLDVGKVVDFGDCTFIIRETKNHQPHTLPMSDFLVDLLTRRHEARESPFVFPSKSERGYLIEPRTAVERVASLSGVPFTLHDLRRTFITIAEGLDIPGYALKRLMNHKDPNDVTAGYIVNDVERLRGPMQRITDFLISAIQTDAESTPAPLKR
ncbi:MAG: tyrosine-type recombinase/integrase [Pseudomonadota bacterium]|nr:tyrosine-type recombinase/integrase [Pseudomonadota bacterium]